MEANRRAELGAHGCTDMRPIVGHPFARKRVCDERRVAYVAAELGSGALGLLGVFLALYCMLGYSRIGDCARVGWGPEGGCAREASSRADSC